MRLALCVNFVHHSLMLCREINVGWPTVPHIGDHVEVLPESRDKSSWDAEVTRTYFHGDGSVELHIDHRGHPEDVIEGLLAELRVSGYREPGGQPGKRP